MQAYFCMTLKERELKKVSQDFRPQLSVRELLLGLVISGFHGLKMGKIQHTFFLLRWIDPLLKKNYMFFDIMSICLNETGVTTRYNRCMI